MTVSKCIQFIMYGIIVGYELPRMMSRFSPQKTTAFPIDRLPDTGKIREMPELQCNPGHEMDNA